MAAREAMRCTEPFVAWLVGVAGARGTAIGEGEKGLVAKGG